MFHTEKPTAQLTLLPTLIENKEKLNRVIEHYIDNINQLYNLGHAVDIAGQTAKQTYYGHRAG